MSSGSMRRDSIHTVDEAKLTKADQRRLARKKREAEWHAFNLTRPDEKWVHVWTGLIVLEPLGMEAVVLERVLNPA